MSVAHLVGFGHERRLFVVAALIGLAVAAAACGGGSLNSGFASLGTTTSTTTAPVGSTTGEPPGGSLVVFATCMRSHGVSNFPDSASFGSSAAIRAAKGQ